MKTLLITCLMMLGFNALRPSTAVAQCTYTVTNSGTLNGALSTATFSTSGTGCTSSIPASGTDATIIIPNGYILTLTGSYAVGRNGLINIQSGGTLDVEAPLTVDASGAIVVGAANSSFVSMGTAALLTIGPSGSLDVSSRATVTVNGEGRVLGDFQLGLGDGTSGQQFTNLQIYGTGRVQSGVLSVNKASIYVAPTANLTTNCNLILYNSNIVDAGQITINGNLDLTPGGANNVLCGTGNVSVAGCVFGGPGAFNHINDNCTSRIGVCASGIASPNCAGPVAGSNANEKACDNLISGCGPLPVELVSFSAKPTAQQGVALQWVTASEKNSESFVVQRSADGQTFRDKMTVAGAGSTQNPTTYNVVDEQPLPGTSYYRLRQVDFDKTVTYSPVRVVTMSSATGQSIEVYPGDLPQKWIVTSTLPTELLTDNATKVKVLDALGRVQTVTCTPDATQAGRWTLDLHSLPTGVYIVRLLTNSGSFSRRIAK